MKKRSILFSAVLVGIISIGLSACNTSSETFTIIWQNYNGITLKVDNNVPYGTIPNYDGETPVRVDNSEFSYTFDGWSPAIKAAKENATYIAQFQQTIQNYTVTWKNYDGTILKVDNNVPYGTIPNYDGNTPLRYSDSQFSYTFNGWSSALTLINKNTTFTACFDVFPVSNSRYVLANDNDFIGTSNGDFKYSGTADFVVIPEKIKGTTFTTADVLLFTNRRDIAGVAFQRSKNIKSMRGLFDYSQATSFDLSTFDTSSVTDMSLMFSDSQVASLNLSNFDTSKVRDMSLMFNNSQVTSINLSSFDTSKVVVMASMFAYSQVASLDLSNFDTSKVTIMSNMFNNSQATFLDLSSFDTSKVTNTNDMFKNSLVSFGYARNEAEAAKFNNLLGRNVFVVKPQI